MLIVEPFSCKGVRQNTGYRMECVQKVQSVLRSASEFAEKRSHRQLLWLPPQEDGRQHGRALCWGQTTSFAVLPSMYCQLPGETCFGYLWNKWLARLVFDILEASKWLLSGDHQRGTVHVPRQSNSSHISSLLCRCSRQFQQVRSLVKNNPTSAIADNIDHCSNGQAPSLSIFSRRRRSENSQTNQLPNPVLWLAIISCWLSRFKPTFFYTEFLNDIRLHFDCHQFACLFVIIVSSELLWIAWYYVKQP